MKKYEISAFADEYSSNPDTQINMLCRNGITCIEPRFIGKKNVSELDIDEYKELGRKLDSAGIKVPSIGSPLGKISLDGDIENHLETARKVFEGANILGAEGVRVFSFYPHKGIPIANSRGEVLNNLGLILELAERFGVTLCHENEAEIYGESPESCLDILDYFGGKLRAVFDMGNFVLCGFDPMEAYLKLRPYIEYFHIKDALFAGAIVPPGKGEAMIPEILRDYAVSVGKKTAITLEPHLETFGGLNKLVGRSFENPYKFDSPEEAFLTALDNLKGILNNINIS